MAWFVIYTKSNSEKKVAEKLSEKGIEVYCPLIQKERKWSDRTRIIEVPLFRSYCFVNLEEKERHLVFEVHGVVRYLYWLKKPAIVKQEEIDVIKNLLNNFDHDALELVDININDLILINSGPFTGIEAKVTEKQGMKITVIIESLKMKISINRNKNIINRI